MFAPIRPTPANPTFSAIIALSLCFYSTLPHVLLQQASFPETVPRNSKQTHCSRHAFSFNRTSARRGGTDPTTRHCATLCCDNLECAATPWRIWRRFGRLNCAFVFGASYTISICYGTPPTLAPRMLVHLLSDLERRFYG